MLTELQIKDFALIDDQTIEFGPGLNVLTGETGAGKSIVLQALQLILGARANASLVRKDTNGWQVTAVFDLSTLPAELLADLPDLAQTPDLVLSRTMDLQGKGRVYINGSIATVSLLEQISKKLLSICGQNQQSLLLDPDYHRALLDDFASNQSLRDEYATTYKEWNQQKARLDDIEARKSKDALRRAELSFILDELQSLNLTPSLRSELETYVSNAGKTEEAVVQCNAILDRIQAIDGVSASLQGMHSSITKLGMLTELPGDVTTFLQTADQAIVDLETALTKVVDNIEVDDSELEAKRDELAEVARLERKYKMNSEGLCELLTSAKEEFELLEDEVIVDELKARVSQLEQELGQQAKKLTDSRVMAAKKLAKAVKQELAELNMPDTTLVLKNEPQGFQATGADKLEFLLSANKGEDPKPLRTIASGGELSRITLVLKKLLRDRKGVNILVFDEVDTGISGGVARAVGVKLKELAQHSQVVCITHLAQVASLSDRHILVEKKVGKRTLTVLRELSEEQRLEEVARMLAGYEVTEASRESAKELLAS